MAEISNSPQIVEATAFNSTLPDGRVSISLSVSVDGCSFATPIGGSIRLPWRGINIERGGANNRLLFLSHAAVPGWQLAVADPNFPNLLASLKHGDLLESMQQSNRVKHRGMVITFAVLLGIFASLFGLYQLKEPAVRVVTDMIPLSWEEQAGDKLFTLHRASSKLIEEKEVKEKLQEFIEPLVVELKKTGYQPKVFIDHSEELNAFAMPGGYVVLNTEVLKRAQTPEEVLGVLAHEFAHVSERHVLRGVISAIGIYFGVSILIGDYAGSLAVIGDALPQLLSLSFSRDYERQADAVGFGFLTRAHINPAGMVEFFKRIKEEEKKQLGAISDLTAGLSFLSTHPTTDERILALEQKLRESQGKQDYLVLDHVFRELKEAVERANK